MGIPADGGRIEGTQLQSKRRKQLASKQHSSIMVSLPEIWQDQFEVLKKQDSDRPRAALVQSVASVLQVFNCFNFVEKTLVAFLQQPVVDPNPHARHTVV